VTDELLSNFALNLNLRHYNLDLPLQLLPLPCLASGLDLVGLDMAEMLTPPQRRCPLRGQHIVHSGAVGYQWYVG
jgi:hypothetical protein